jgi:hypothetical protein
MLATLHDQLPGGNHTASMFLYTCSSNPTRSVLWVGLDQRVEEHSSTLDISNFRFSFQDHTVEVRQVAFWVDGCRSATNRRGSRYLLGPLGTNQKTRAGDITWSSLRERTLSLA